MTDRKRSLGGKAATEWLLPLRASITCRFRISASFAAVALELASGVGVAAVTCTRVK